MKKIEKDKKVTLDYEAIDEEGNIIDKSTEDSHLHVLIGHNNVVPGFEDNLLDMKEEEEKIFTISPEDGYGDYKEELVKEVDKKAIPESEKLEKGMFVQLMSSDGQPLLAKVKDITDDKVYFDFNHPFAGKKITFKVKILKIDDPTKEELEHGHVHE